MRESPAFTLEKVNKCSALPYFCFVLVLIAVFIFSCNMKIFISRYIDFLGVIAFIFFLFLGPNKYKMYSIGYSIGSQLRSSLSFIIYHTF